MAFATGFEGFVMTLRWCRVDVVQGNVSPKPRWFQWGYILRNEFSTGNPYAWYILIGLPIYVMETPPWRDGEPTLHQRHLLFKEQIPSGESGWHWISWECQ